MKILKENKEKLPIDFITQFISTSWSEVGNLKASIQGIKDSFKDTKKAEEILQEVIDAYLIAIGQFEAYLKDKNYIQIEDLTESLIEDANDIESVREISNLIKDEVEAIDGYDKALEKISDNTVNAVIKHIKDEEKEHINELSNTLNNEVDDNEAEIVGNEIKQKIADEPIIVDNAEDGELFEYFTDFDEPELTEEDKALYNSSRYMNIK